MSFVQIAGRTRYESLVREDVKVRVFGNTAVHTSQTHYKLINNGQPQSFSVKMIRLVAVLESTA